MRFKCRKCLEILLYVALVQFLVTMNSRHIVHNQDYRHIPALGELKSLSSTNSSGNEVVAIDNASLAETLHVNYNYKNFNEGNKNIFSSKIHESFASVKTKVLGTRRKETGFLTIGIPSTPSEDGNHHLFNTVSNLVNMTSHKEQSNIVMVIYLTGTNLGDKETVAKKIQSRFKSQLESGFLLIVESVKGLKTNAKLSPERVRAFDIAYLMLFCRNISKYYLQLEDGVKTVPGYMNLIRGFIDSQKVQTWALISLANSGFIGKLFQSENLNQLSVLLSTFSMEQNIPTLFTYFETTMTQRYSIRHKDILFRFTGKISSYDTDMGFTKLVSSSVNPPAYVITTMKTYPGYGVQNFYAGKDIFWTLDLVVGDTITIVFAKPEFLKHLTVETGKEQKQKRVDAIVQGNIAVYSKLKTFDAANKEVICEEGNVAGTFVNGKSHVQLTSQMSVKCVVITLTAHQKTWIIFNKILLT